MSQSFNFTVIPDTDLAEIKTHLLELRATQARSGVPSSTPMPDPTHARRVELAADGFVSVADAMAFLSLGETEVYALMGDGTIAWARHGKRRLVSKRSLVEFGAARLVDVSGG